MCRTIRATRRIHLNTYIKSSSPKLKKKLLRASQMRVCGLPVLSAASLSETERGAGGADTADPSSTATAAQPMRVGSAASAAGAPAQTTPSDCKLGANLSGNALGEDVSVETTRVLQLDPASTARTANAGPALPRGAGISALRHIDANNSAFNMLNEAGAAAALTPNEPRCPLRGWPNLCCCCCCCCS